MTGFEPGVSGVRIKSPHLPTALGGRHRSVVSSAPTILQPRVRIPSSPSTLFFSKLYYLNCIEKITKINKKRPGLAHFSLFIRTKFYRKI